MAAFVLGDLTANNPTLFGGQNNDILEIDGETISYEQFQSRMDELTLFFSLTTQVNPSVEQIEQIREQAWQSFLIENAYEPEFKSIGLEVSEAEWKELIQGKNPHQHIQQFFGQQFGDYQPKYVTDFNSNLSQAVANGTPGAEQQDLWWRIFQSKLPRSKKLQRLDILMDKTNYVTKAEAKARHQADNSNVTLEYIFVPFSSVTDSTIAVTQSELEEYIEENTEKYQREESRDIAFVNFPIIPSVEDSLRVVKEMDEAVSGFMKTENDSSYAARNTDGQFPFMTYRTSTLPEYLMKDGKPLNVGEMTEVNTVVNQLVVYKVSRKKEVLDSVKARHILFKWDTNSSESKEDVQVRAQAVLNDALAGRSFSQLARSHSEDLSNASDGGDLGWFKPDGTMVLPFQQACFSQTETGIIPEIVETQFGFHIIQLDQLGYGPEYKVAIIEKPYFVSNETRDEIYRQAGLFQTSTSDASEFLNVAEEKGLKMQNQKRISPQASQIGILDEARTLVRWLFNDAEVGSVSEVYEIGDNYVVAVMTDLQKEGVARLTDIENEITTKVRNEKKAVIITEKLNNLSGSYSDQATTYGEAAKSGEVTINLTSNSIAGIGIAPKIVGTAFALSEGDESTAITTNNGVVKIKLISKILAEDTDDYTLFVQQLTNQRNSRKVVVSDFPLSFFPVQIGIGLEKAIKDLSDIEDKRHKFF